jgi:hypothetical protein
VSLSELHTSEVTFFCLSPFSCVAHYNGHTYGMPCPLIRRDIMFNYTGRFSLNTTTSSTSNSAELTLICPRIQNMDAQNLIVTQMMSVSPPRSIEATCGMPTEINNLERSNYTVDIVHGDTSCLLGKFSMSRAGEFIEYSHWFIFSKKKSLTCSTWRNYRS